MGGEFLIGEWQWEPRTVSRECNSKDPWGDVSGSLGRSRLRL